VAALQAQDWIPLGHPDSVASPSVAITVWIWASRRCIAKCLGQFNISKMAHVCMIPLLTMVIFWRIFFICKRFLVLNPTLDGIRMQQLGSARELEGLRCRSQRISPRPQRYSGVTQCFILDLHGMSDMHMILHIYIFDCICTCAYIF